MSDKTDWDSTMTEEEKADARARVLRTLIELEKSEKKKREKEIEEGKI